jgi:hypothetical protein
LFDDDSRPGDNDDDDEDGNCRRPMSEADRRVLLLLAVQKYSLDYQGLLFLVALQKIFMNVEETDRETHAAIVEFDVLVNEGRACNVDLLPDEDDEEAPVSDNDEPELECEQRVKEEVEEEEEEDKKDVHVAASPEMAALMARLVNAQFALLAAAASSATPAPSVDDE